MGLGAFCIIQLFGTVSVDVCRKLVTNARVCLEEIQRQNVGRNKHFAQETLLHVSPAVGVYYRGADKSLARPRRKQATATEDLDVHISYL